MNSAKSPDLYERLGAAVGYFPVFEPCPTSEFGIIDGVATSGLTVVLLASSNDPVIDVSPTQAFSEYYDAEEAPKWTVKKMIKERSIGNTETEFYQRMNANAGVGACSGVFDIGAFLQVRKGFYRQIFITNRNTYQCQFDEKVLKQAVLERRDAIFADLDTHASGLKKLCGFVTKVHTGRVHILSHAEKATLVHVGAGFITAGQCSIGFRTNCDRERCHFQSMEGVIGIQMRCFILEKANDQAPVEVSGYISIKKANRQLYSGAIEYVTKEGNINPMNPIQPVVLVVPGPVVPGPFFVLRFLNSVAVWFGFFLDYLRKKL